MKKLLIKLTSFILVCCTAFCLLSSCSKVGSFSVNEKIVCEVGGEPVSSTRIRHNIAQGRVAEAAHLLGYRYAIEGSVVGGYGIGHKVGFPTANIQPSNDSKLLPADGVYAVKACLGYENEEVDNVYIPKSANQYLYPGKKPNNNQ